MRPLPSTYHHILTNKMLCISPITIHLFITSINIIADHVLGMVLVTGSTVVKPMDKVPDKVLRGEAKKHKIRQPNKVFSENEDDHEENKKGKWDRRRLGGAVRRAALVREILERVI